MYRKHPDFYTPDDSSPVWHYFSLPKFIGLLESSDLYFSRQDQFDDAGEGRLSQFDKNFLRQYSADFAKRMESDEMGCYYANCWTLSESDEYVLWNTYASLSDGIAVKSSIGRIKKALAHDRRSVYIAKIQYYDENTGSTFDASGGIINLLSLAFSKRNYFKAENEVRLLYHDNDARLDSQSPLSVSFHVELNELIDSIYVAPKSYMWFTDAISHMIELYGLSDIQVHKSKI